MFAPDTTVQLPTVATPSAPVNAGEPVTLPPLGAKSTWALGTARFDESSTSTAGLTLLASPARPTPIVPPLMTTHPRRPPNPAPPAYVLLHAPPRPGSCCCGPPPVVPTVQVTWACPSAPVVSLGALTLPPPYETTKSTIRFWMGLPRPSLTCATSALGSCPPTESIWPSPDTL